LTAEADTGRRTVPSCGYTLLLALIQDAAVRNGASLSPARLRSAMLRPDGEVSMRSARSWRTS
jgi:hypothetical protein